jgi:hypothetical protein
MTGYCAKSAPVDSSLPSEMTMAGSFDNRQSSLGRRSFARELSSPRSWRWRLDSSTGTPMRDLVQRAPAVLYPAICSVTASGQYLRPAAARSSASAAPPFGLRYPDKSCSQSVAKRFLQSLRKCRASALGSRAHSLASPKCDPSRIGKFNKRRQDHVPEQSQPHRIPRQ